MKPMTIGFFITFTTCVWLVISAPHLWFFALVTTLYAGVGMVQADLINVLVGKIKEQNLLLNLSKATLEAANDALKAASTRHTEKKEDA